jgi:glycosyltransferase involved in cell wall biosynthesis
MRSNLRISIIVPALNEELVIQANVRDFVAVAAQYFHEFEFILVDDGSTDRTGALMDALAAEDPRLSVLHNRPNIGLGASYRKALSQARYDYVMMLCGDGGLPASSLPPVFEQVGNADIVIPYMSNMEEVKTGERKALSSAYTLLLNTLFRQNLYYYNGLQVHRLDLLRNVEISSFGFAFQGEILIQLLTSGASYVQVQTLAAEKTNRSAAIKLTNFVDVAKVLLRLLAFVYLPNSARRRLKSICAQGVKAPAAASRTKPVSETLAV